MTNAGFWVVRNISITWSSSDDGNGGAVGRGNDNDDDDGGGVNNNGDSKKFYSQTCIKQNHIKSVSTIGPGRRLLKSPIWLKLGRKIECHQHIHVLKYQVKIFHFTRVMGKT